MSLILVSERSPKSRPVFAVRPGGRERLDPAVARWAEFSRFDGAAGEICLVPDGEGSVRCILFGLGKANPRDESDRARASLLAGHLARRLPAGDWHLEDAADLDESLAGLALRLGAYEFTRYKTGKKSEAPNEDDIRVHLGEKADPARNAAIADGIALTRDLVNTPVNDMGPAELEAAIHALGEAHGARTRSIVGDDLLAANFPMIHAVGRASASAPRLVDLVWGREDAPKITLVGKGVCFDTGGLDIKPPSNMILMKKDMGGAANVLGLASMIMATKLDVRLRVLVPAVENAVAGNAFRPSDVLTSRKGKTVEIGNTDAEGRLVLADALALADEESPDVLVDMATLTGAARVALGPDLPAFFSPSRDLAGAVEEAGIRLADPIWRLPLYRPYEAELASKVADTNNISQGGFAGAITAALFLEGFVENAKEWAHLDIYGWRPKPSAIGAIGGEAYAIRALFETFSKRYGGAR